jgi:hypothetical protein
MSMALRPTAIAEVLQMLRKSLLDRFIETPSIELVWE